MHARQLLHAHVTALAVAVLAASLAGGCTTGLSGSGSTTTGTDGSGLPTPTPGPSGPAAATPTPTPSPTPTPTPDTGTNGETTEPTPTPTPTPGVPTGPCAANSDCDNLVYCDGVELCINNVCQAGEDPCPSQFEECDEQTQSCVPITLGCLSDADCDPGQNCDVNSGACIAPLAINCGPGAGVCNIANYTPGCENQDCCNDVCIQDPSCCSLSWDDGCALLAITLSSCLAN